MYRLKLARMGRLFTLVMLMVMITRVSSRHSRDIWSGDYKKYRESAEVEVIRRTPVRTLHNGEVVNKVLKRRKKYRRLPTRRVDADKISDASADNGNNSDDKPQLRETNESFEKLKPLKTNYKTSDSIRMHLQTPNHKIKTSRSSESGQHENKRNSIKGSTRTKQPLALSDNFEFKKNSKKQTKKASPRQYDEQIGAESREHKTYKRFYGSHEEVLLASGDHNSLSIQGPVQNSLVEDNYDYTIGRIIKMRLSIFDGNFLLIIGGFGRTRGQQRSYPTTPSPYKQYPGLYFPPTDSSEDRNPLKNYDFIIGLFVHRYILLFNVF